MKNVTLFPRFVCWHTTDSIMNRMIEKMQQKPSIIRAKYREMFLLLLLVFAHIDNSLYLIKKSVFISTRD